MKKNLFKNLILILIITLVTSSYNFVLAEEISAPLTCTAPQVLNAAGDACVDVTPEVITCTEPQVLVDGVCSIPVVETPLPVNIHLDVISGTNSLYDADISVNACDSEGDGVLKVTPYCALSQAGISSDWASLWINSIGGFQNDFSNNVYWMWLSNLNIDNTSPTSSYNLSAKQYVANENDRILFYYNTNPLIISVDNTSPEVGQDIVVSVKELGLDASWDPVWTKSANSKIVIGTDTFDTDLNGEYKINIKDLNTFNIFGRKDLFIDTESIKITPVAQKEIITDTPGGGGSSGSSSGSISKSFSNKDAIKFLENNQNIDGSFGGDSMYTDWAAIAVAAGGSRVEKNNISNYLKNNTVDSDVVTDNERRAMALMALGINPYSGTDVDYIKKIVDSFDGVQIGENTLVNDDIFGLIVLSHAGYNVNDPIVKETIKYIISNQLPDGSWGSVDMTSASIMALRDFVNEENVSFSISLAENYLVRSQGKDGGFGNSFSTSWAAQALAQNGSLSIEADKAIKYLANIQSEDGGLEGSDMDNRIWATSYAIPASLNLFWSGILEYFDKVVKEKESSITDSVLVKDEETTPVVLEEKKEEILSVNKVEDKIVRVERKKKSIEVEKKKTEEGSLYASAATSNSDVSNSIFSFIPKIFSGIKLFFSWLLVHLNL